MTRSTQRYSRNKGFDVLLVVVLAEERCTPVTYVSNGAFPRVMNTTYKPVPAAKTGQTELNRMPFGPYSTAIVLVALITAAFDALYHARPGRGRIPAVDAMLMKLPPLPSFRRYGRMTLVDRYIDRTLTLNTRSKSLSVTVSVGCIIEFSFYESIELP